MSAMRRISGVRDIERVTTDNDRADPEHIAISKSKGIKIDWKDGHHSEYALGLPARRMPLRHLHRRARHGAAEIELLGALRVLSRCTSPR